MACQGCEQRREWLRQRTGMTVTTKMLVTGGLVIAAVVVIGVIGVRKRKEASGEVRG